MPARRAISDRLLIAKNGQTIHFPDFMFQHREAANFPWVSQAEWLYTQLLRWDGLEYTPADAAAAARVCAITPGNSGVGMNKLAKTAITVALLAALPDEEVAAAIAANAHEFIQRMPHGYDTILGERGDTISGGQRQRIAIARALIGDPRILILDEATSALDSRTEAAIQATLRRVRKGRTTLVVAHRLSTIADADQILVLDDGEIIERGTHRELMALNRRYRELYDRQYRLETDRFINPGEDFTVSAQDDLQGEAQKVAARAGRNL